ncbi:hypothetical protein D3C74_317370 [compost metagenome]
MKQFGRYERIGSSGTYSKSNQFCLVRVIPMCLHVEDINGTQGTEQLAYVVLCCNGGLYLGSRDRFLFRTNAATERQAFEQGFEFQLGQCRASLFFF